MMMKVWFLYIEVRSDRQETTYFKRVFKKLHAICRDKVQTSHPPFNPPSVLLIFPPAWPCVAIKWRGGSLASAAAVASV
jgi:hypothetical protein